MNEDTIKDNRIKEIATRKENDRVFKKFQLPPKDIVAECSDGTWIKRAWTTKSNWGWHPWEKKE